MAIMTSKYSERRSFLGVAKPPRSSGGFAWTFSFLQAVELTEITLRVEYARALGGDDKTKRELIEAPARTLRKMDGTKVFMANSSCSVLILDSREQA